MPRLHIQCACGRQQTIVPRYAPGGITHEEAKLVGWKLEGETWTCPFCAGDTSKLHEVLTGRKVD